MPGSSLQVDTELDTTDTVDTRGQNAEFTFTFSF